MLGGLHDGRRVLRIGIGHEAGHAVILELAA
jgi:hypothetical protein